ncbi:MAG: SHOCT domain-containing protein [Gemmataceae bacterium]|jgi:hypothetical protein
MRLIGWLAVKQVPIWQDNRFSLAFYGMLLAGALLLGALLIAWAGKIWREDQKKGSGKPEDQLSEFRSMLDSGEISQEEFEKLRQTLGKKILPTATPKEATPASPNPEQTPPNGDANPS